MKVIYPNKQHTGVIRLGNVEYLLFKYLWIIVICSKPVQLLMLAMLAFLCCVTLNKKIKLDKFALLMLIVCLIHLTSIIFNAFMRNIEQVRLYAALNTLTVMIIGILFYSYYKIVTPNLNKVGKYLFINLIILLGLYIASLILNEKGNFGFMPNNLVEVDWFDGKMQYRFNGYSDFANAVTFIACLCWGGALKYVTEKYGVLVANLLSIGVIFVAYGSGSRAGLVCMVTLYLIFAFSTLVAKKNLKQYKRLLLFFAFVILLLGTPYLYKAIIYLIAARQGSNALRIEVYLESLHLMFSQSPVIGLGIKDMFGIIPYGSHSTYVGMFYKAGMVGGVLFLCVIIGQIRIILKHRTNNAAEFTLKCTILIFFVLFLVEDIDSVDWLPAMFFSLQAMTQFQNSQFINKSGDMGDDKHRSSVTPLWS
jgi:hypothetical protein